VLAVTLLLFYEISLCGLPKQSAALIVWFGLAPGGTDFSFLAGNLRFCHHSTPGRI